MKGLSSVASSNRTPDTIEIQLTQGHVAVIDAVDSDLIAHKWHVKNNLYVYRVQRKPTFRHILLHREILTRMLGRELRKGEIVDHINLNPLDNRRGNLRLATHSQNHANTRKPKSNTSGVKGVSWSKVCQKWDARLQVQGKSIYLGVFDTIEEAAEAYRQAAERYHGEFARTE